MPAEENLPEELQSLARRHALEITEQDFDEDVIKLSRALERALGWTPKPARSGAHAVGDVPEAGSGLEHQLLQGLRDADVLFVSPLVAVQLLALDRIEPGARGRRVGDAL